MLSVFSYKLDPKCSEQLGLGLPVLSCYCEVLSDSDQRVTRRWCLGAFGLFLCSVFSCMWILTPGRNLCGDWSIASALSVSLWAAGHHICGTKHFTVSGNSYLGSFEKGWGSSTGRPWATAPCLSSWSQCSPLAEPLTRALSGITGRGRGQDDRGPQFLFSPAVQRTRLGTLGFIFYGSIHKSAVTGWRLPDRWLS